MKIKHTGSKKMKVYSLSAIAFIIIGIGMFAGYKRVQKHCIKQMRREIVAVVEEKEKEIVKKYNLSEFYEWIDDDNFDGQEIEFDKLENNDGEPVCLAKLDSEENVPLKQDLTKTPRNK